MFIQSAPELGNQFEDDRMLRGYLERTLPKEAQAAVFSELSALGALAGGELFKGQQEDRTSEPTLIQWDPWGRRVDRIEVTRQWQRAKRVACEFGLIATGHEGALDALSRVHQFAKIYLFEPSSDTYSCPLAMTDGAVQTLKHHKHDALIARAVPRLMSRDPDSAWTSGQWMTERTGGSDVSRTETAAKKDGEQFRLYGTKWFTSATTAEMALTLARPEGNPAGSRGLALFYVERSLPDGTTNGIFVNRLKDKLGTRKLPTAELTLDGALATPVAGHSDGVRNISPMLNVTRTWNAVCAAAGMRRGLALCRDYAKRRLAFGRPLSDKPLHLDTLAGMQAECEAGFHLAMRAAELLGLPDGGGELGRIVIPLAKLVTGKQVVAVASEALECFGGAGYVEDVGVARLLRDAQVLPIWEGTTNVLSLDVLRVCASSGALEALTQASASLASEVREEALAGAARAASQALTRAERWLLERGAASPQDAEAMARAVAMTLGRSHALLLLCRHAQWALERNDPLPRAAALRFATHGTDHLRSPSEVERALALT